MRDLFLAVWGVGAALWCPLGALYAAYRAGRSGTPQRRVYTAAAFAVAVGAIWPAWLTFLLLVHAGAALGARHRRPR